METTLVLEKSSNTHVLETTEGKITENVNHDGGIMTVTTEKAGAIVTHGEHGTLTVESTKMTKYIQQEVNPITKALMNAID